MKQKNKLISWLVGGILLALGPMWGMIGTVVGMVLAFGHLAESEPQTEVLANDISLALYTTAAGLVICPIGIVIIVITTIKLNKTKKKPE